MGVIKWVWHQFVDLVKTIVRITLIILLMAALLVGWAEYRDEINGWFNEHVMQGFFGEDVKEVPEKATGPPPTDYTRHRLTGTDPPVTYKVPVLEDSSRLLSYEGRPPDKIRGEVLLL